MKIRTKILFIIFLLIVITGAATILAVRTVAINTIKQQVGNHLKDTAQLSARYLETFLDENQKKVKMIASSFIFRDIVCAKKEDADYALKYKTVQKRLHSLSKAIDKFHNISIIDKNGIIVISTNNKLSGYDLSDDAAFKKGITDTFVKDIYRCSGCKKPVVGILSPIIKNNESIGVVFVNIKTAELNKITTDRTGLGKTGEIYIVNKNGCMITPSRFVKDAVLKQRVDTENTRSYFKHTERFGKKEHEHKELVFKNYVGKDVLGVHSHIYGINWCLIAEISKEEAFAPVAAMINTMFVVFAFFLIAGILFAFLITKTITGPILRLRRGVERLRNGNLDYKVGTKAKDEVGELSRAFDTMAVNLKKSRDELKKHSKNLEEMVTERTARLEEEYKKSEDQRIATLNILQDMDEVNENLMQQIAEKKKLEGQLLQAGKMEAVGTLAGGIAHDFNNLLQAIIGYTQILLMDKDRGDSDFDKLTQIENSAQRARELTQQLLTFSRKVESKLRPVNINQEIKQIEKLLKRTIPRMIDIELHLEENIKVINADPAQVEQVLMNLGVNARDAMPDGGKLVVETENVILDKEYCKTHLGAVHGEHMLLSFSDTGHGMDKETVEHIFEPFYTTKETGKGTGLGLAMVYGIVKSHDGYIMCYSEPGKGTTFKIYFPAIDSVVSSGLSVERKEEMPGGNETILLVDDEEAILDVARNMLERFGYTAITAESGEKAIEIYKAQKERIDLVILDLGMPGIGGHKCLKELLKIDSRIKVIIASGYLKIEKVKETVESVASGFIGKPYQLSGMLKKVREVLGD